MIDFKNEEINSAIKVNAHALGISIISESKLSEHKLKVKQALVRLNAINELHP